MGNEKEKKNFFETFYVKTFFFFFLQKQTYVEEDIVPLILSIHV